MNEGGRPLRSSSRRIRPSLLQLAALALAALTLVAFAAADAPVHGETAPPSRGAITI